MKLILETKRIYLREMTPPDAPFIFELNNDSEVIKYTGDKSFVDEEEARKFLVNYDQYQKYGMGRWAVVSKHNNIFLGWCGLKFMAEDETVDLGFRIMKKYWNQGLTTEAAKACIDYGFSTLQLNRIIGRAMVMNRASIRVLEKTGMKYEKEIWFGKEKGVLYAINNK